MPFALEPNTKMHVMPKKEETVLFRPPPPKTKRNNGYRYMQSAVGGLLFLVYRLNNHMHFEIVP
jgi:hypothetical protein